MAGNGNGIPSVADVVVVGSGSAGAVVARRLADAGAHVALLEAGGPDVNPAIHDPARLFELWDGEEDWGYRTLPQAALADRALHWPRGKVLGGSSALNGMVYVARPSQRLRPLGLPRQRGWGYDDVLPLLPALRGLRSWRLGLPRRGWAAARVSRYEPHPVNAATVAAAREAGHPVQRRPQRRASGGRRVRRSSRFATASARVPAGAFLAPVAGAAEPVRPRRARTRCGCSSQASAAPASSSRTATGSSASRADGEVVVCAGAIESPKLSCSRASARPASSARLGIDVRLRPSRCRAQPPRSRARPRSSTPRREPVPPPAAGPSAAPQPPLLAQPPRPSRARHPAALLPSPALPGGHGGPARRLHADGAGSSAPRAAARCGSRSADPSDAAAHRSGATSRCEADADALVAARRAVPRDRRARMRSPPGAARELYPGPAVRTRDELRDYVERAPPSPTTTRSARAGWASTSSPSSIRSCACAASTASGSPTPPSCRSSPPATRTRRP